MSQAAGRWPRHLSSPPGIPRQLVSASLQPPRKRPSVLVDLAQREEVLVQHESKTRRLFDDLVQIPDELLQLSPGMRQLSEASHQEPADLHQFPGSLQRCSESLRRLLGYLRQLSGYLPHFT